MPFLPPNQQRQSTEGIESWQIHLAKSNTVFSNPDDKETRQKHEQTNTSDTLK